MPEMIDYIAEAAALMSEFWKQYKAAPVRRQWDPIFRSSGKSKNDIVREFGQNYTTLCGLAAKAGISIDNIDWSALEVSEVPEL